VRDDVLDALERILIADGVGSATLDAVAAEAGASKGGLLYHFPNKKALFEGLVERMRERAAQDLEAMRASADGPAIYYVRSSLYEGSDFDQTLIAASRLVQESDTAVRDAFESIRSDWLALIREEVGDPARAEAILLMGDGLYYNALLTGAGGPTGARGAKDIDGVLAVVEGLKNEEA
jgi:AcrR family transcriptional regulator